MFAHGAQIESASDLWRQRVSHRRFGLLPTARAEPTTWALGSKTDGPYNDQPKLAPKWSLVGRC